MPITVKEFNDISIKVPARLLTLGINQAYLQEALAALFYHNDTLSLKEAREMIGKSRREFEEEVLPKFGFTTLGETDEDLAIELNA